MALITTPTTDIALTFTPNAATGQITVDIPLTASNEFARVVGPARLVQDVTRWLLTPLGAYVFDPTFGNPILGQLLMPSSGDPNTYLAMVQTAEQAFIARQQIDAAAGWLSADETVVSFTNMQVTIGNGGSNGPIGSVNVSFNIVTQAGTTLPVFAPFSALIA